MLQLDVHRGRRVGKPASARKSALRLSWLAGSLCICLAAALWMAASAGAYTASLTRTTGGIANIEAGNLGDAGFATGYAQAEDGICTLADVYLTVDGERSRYLGPTATVIDEAAGVRQTNLASDFYWTSVNEAGTVESLLEKPFPQGPSAAAKELVSGFAAGYDAYLAHIGGPSGITDPRCAGAAWVRPISSIDVWRRLYELATIEGGSPRAELIVDATPPEADPRPLAAPRSSSSATSSGGASTAATVRSRIAAEAPKLDEAANALDGNFHAPEAGSNGLAIGAEDATDGGGLVLANPHFPWIGDERFWESHVDVPGVYDAIGAGLWGSPLVLIGHNQHVAWTHTVSTNVTTTTWALALVPGHPTEYFLDGKPVAMTNRTVTVKAFEHGVIVPRSHTFYYTTHGPVIGGLYPWNEQEAFAFDDANANNLRVVDQWLAIGQAESAQGVIEAEKKIEGVPWVNTIGADDEGNAFYSEIAVTPFLPTSYLESPCNLGGGPGGPFVGWESACELPNDPGAVVGQIFSGADSPSVVRKDYVENSNNSFWLANAEDPLTGYSPAFGEEEVNPGMRSQTGIDMVNQRMGAGNGGTPTDGLSSTPGFTVPTLRDSWTAFRSMPAERTLPYLIALCEGLATGTSKGVVGPIPSIGLPAVDVTPACPALEEYDGNESSRLESPGGWLFSEWFEHAPVGNSEFWVNKWEPVNPVYTPNTVNLNPAAKVTEEDAAALAYAVFTLESRQIPLNASFGEVQFAPQHTLSGGRIPVPGCDERDYCFAIVDSSYDSPSASTTTANYGSSIVMFTEMNQATGPLTQGLLTYSQSEDITSPFYEDQTADFSQNKWITLPWTAAQVSADALAPPRTLSNEPVVTPPPPPVQVPKEGSEPSKGKHPSPPLTRAQKLKRALAQCAKKKSKAKRAACKTQARKRYGPPMTRAQKLRRALRQCAKKKSKAKRMACRKHARNRYGPKKHHTKHAKKHRTKQSTKGRSK